MHRSKHGSDESVDTITLLDEWYERRNPALVVRYAAEMHEDQTLEGVDAVLEIHQIGNSLISVRSYE